MHVDITIHLTRDDRENWQASAFMEYAIGRTQIGEPTSGGSAHAVLSQIEAHIAGYVYRLDQDEQRDAYMEAGYPAEGLGVVDDAHHYSDYNEDTGEYS